MCIKKRPHRASAWRIALLCGSFPFAAFASPADLSVTAFAEGAGYQSTETIDGQFFDRDSGVLRGLSLRGDYAEASLRLHLDVRRLENGIDYTGHNQIGVPLTSKTDLKYSQNGIFATYRVFDSPFFAGVALRTRGIERSIEPTPITQGLRETLNQVEWGPVAAGELKLSANTSFVGQVTLLKTLRSNLSVDFLGNFDPGTLTLASNSSSDILLQLKYDIDAKYGLVMEVEGQRYAPAHSSYALLTKNGMPLGIYDYPGSTQSAWILGIGARIKW